MGRSEPADSMETTAAAITAGAPHQKLVFTYDSQWRRVSKVVSNFTGGVWVEASISIHL